MMIHGKKCSRSFLSSVMQQSVGWAQLLLLGEENKLVITLRKNIMKTTRVLLRAHPMLLKCFPIKSGRYLSSITLLLRFGNRSYFRQRKTYRAIALFKQVMTLIRGNGHFRKQLSTLWIINSDPVCRLCKQYEETAIHIILLCDSLKVRRRAIFRASLPGGDSDANIR